jgi:hypothetical protein
MNILRIIARQSCFLCSGNNKLKYLFLGWDLIEKSFGIMVQTLLLCIMCGIINKIL